MEVQIMDKERVLYLLDSIEEDTVNPLIRRIIDINIDDDLREESVVDFKREPIKLIINTSGGIVAAGFALVSIIENSKTPIYAYIQYRCASMGVDIALSCDKVFMNKRGYMMIHEISTRAGGNLESIKDRVKYLDRMQKSSDEIITSNSKITQEQLDEVYSKKDDWHIYYDEALSLGLVVEEDKE